MRSRALIVPAMLLAGCLVFTALVMRSAGRQATANSRILELQTVGGKTRVAIDTLLQRASFGLYRRSSRVSSDDLEALRRSASDAARTLSWAGLGLVLCAALLLLAAPPGGLLPSLLLLGALLLVPGLLAPMLTIRFFAQVPLFGEIVLQAESRSILGSVGFLLGHQNLLLGAIIGLFSVVVPIGKLLLIGLALATGVATRRVARFLETIGAWSMLDVFVAAVTVVFFAVGSTRGTDARVGVGLYFFAGYGLLSLAATRLYLRRSSTHSPGAARERADTRSARR